jgi:hypothetical protein
VGGPDPRQLDAPGSYRRVSAAASWLLHLSVVAVVDLSFPQLVAAWDGSVVPSSAVVPGEPLVMVVGSDGPTLGAHDPIPSRWPGVVVAFDRSGDEHRPRWADLVVTDDDQLERVVRQVHDVPIASTSLVQVLRGAEERTIADGILLESAVYSTLQAGPEFGRWRSTHGSAHPGGAGGSADGAPSVIAVRNGDELLVRLHRPHVHNALDRSMRDALIEAFSVAQLDASIESVQLSGDGPSYSAGGDLGEFGTFPDPASAHLLRTTLAIGPLVASLGDRLVVRLHGACLGSGIEIPAFAGRVVAGPDTSIGLPELGLGLIPGAGGTWSLPQRIGRHRTAWLALTGHRIDAGTAHAWGLVDELV